MAKSDKVRLHRKTLRATDTITADLPGTSDLFTVYVINRSDWKVVRWNTTGDDPWYEVSPPIGKNCEASRDECWQGGQYKELHSFRREAAFDLYLILVKKGEKPRWPPPVRIDPTVKAGGIAICVNN